MVPMLSPNRSAYPVFQPLLERAVKGRLNENNEESWVNDVESKKRQAALK